jgi:hypothetical protein
MKREARKIFNQLKKLGCPVKEWHYDDRGYFWISAEEESSPEWLDYWSNYEGSELLNEILNKNGFYWEWHNPGYGCVYDI